jgi:hypothetical protein
MRPSAQPRLVAALAAVALGAMASVSAAQARPSTGPASTGPSPTLAALQAAERDSILKDLANRPRLPPAPLADVAQLGRDGEHLTLLTRLTATAGQCRIDVTDLAGFCDVNHTALRRRGVAPVVPGAAKVPDLFLFNWYQFDHPGDTVVATTLTVLPANLQVVRMTETPDGGETQLQLTELRNATPASLTAGGDPGVRLRFTDAGAAGLPPPPDVDCTADSFADLARLHPTEVARCLEPVLRDLHADMAVLPPDRPLAYQVFAPEVRVDERTAATVRRLVAQLDADDFRDRDAAGDQLRALGPIAAVAVGRMDDAALSPEQRARTAALLRHFRPVSDAAAAGLRENADFLLNCLRDPDPFVTHAALARLAVVVGQPVAFDGTLEGRPRWDAVWQLRESLEHRSSADGAR